jgi:hypothetical protein
MLDSLSARDAIELKRVVNCPYETLEGASSSWSASGAGGKA